MLGINPTTDAVKKAEIFSSPNRNHIKKVKPTIKAPEIAEINPEGQIEPAKLSGTIWQIIQSKTVWPR